jgi:hypothetical protein
MVISNATVLANSCVNGDFPEFAFLEMDANTTLVIRFRRDSDQAD